MTQTQFRAEAVAFMVPVGWINGGLTEASEVAILGRLLTYRNRHDST